MLQFVFQGCEFLDDSLAILALLLVCYVTNGAMKIVNGTCLTED
jgi:hypothetical protein